MSSEGNDYASPAESFAPEIIGDDPDENGYSGPVIQMESIDELSEDGEMFDAAPFHQDGEPQPDEDEYYSGASIQNEIAEWSDFYYRNVSGATLRPRSSTTGWGYFGSGCIYITSGAALLTIDLHLPQGARVDYLRLYYNDTATTNSTAWLTHYNAAGGFTDLTSVSSAGSAGYGTTLSPFVNHVVNNFNQAYVLNWQQNSTGSSQSLCGLRVAYRLPTN